MSFYETPRRNASDSTTASNRSTHRGHRREHSDPCPLPSPGLPHKALSTPELSVLGGHVDRRPSDSTSLGMNVVAAGSGNVNDTRRRPATVAVAVCIQSMGVMRAASLSWFC